MTPKLAIAACLVCGPCLAQVGASAAPKPDHPVQVQPALSEPGEPNVQRTVLEDEGSRIEQLRVRGQVQYVVVTPKVIISRPYEIIVPRSARDPVDGTGGTNSALGKRVWNILDF